MEKVNVKLDDDLLWEVLESLQTNLFICFKNIIFKWKKIFS
jgi:hypothetical protein